MTRTKTTWRAGSTRSTVMRTYALAASATQAASPRASRCSSASGAGAAMTGADDRNDCCQALSGAVRVAPANPLTAIAGRRM
jgi:hypothetical protein